MSERHRSLAFTASMGSEPLLVKVVDLGLGSRVEATQSLVASALEDQGWKVERVRLPANGLPRRVSRAHKHVTAAFTATPAALKESWRIARHLNAVTEPGDTVLLPDRAGVAGLFAVEQAMRPLNARRSVLVTAADSLALEYLAIAGTYDGVPEDVEFAIDWELTGYRFAAAVLATSERAIEYLASVGIGAELILAATADDAPTDAPRPSTVWLPEPVARLSQTPTMLRALNLARIEAPTLKVFVSDTDRPDLIWNGTTWEAMAGTRALFDDAIQRVDGLTDPDLILLGDPYAVPDDEINRLRKEGISVVVPEGSTASSYWPDAATWGTEHDLADALAGGATSAGSRVPARLLIPTHTTDPSRAQRVSVAVPVFRQVAYLDACIQSILSQDQPPHEVILIDDGSRSEDVSRAIGAWSEQYPNLIRSLSQPNQGVCVARNLALESMTGDAFLLVDADDELEPSFIAVCADALRANPDLWAVATWTEFFGDYNGIEAKPPFDRRVGRRENPIVSTCVVVDMRVRDLGIRFEPDLAYLYCEDWDVWAKVVAAGGSFGLIPEPLARHRVTPGQGASLRTGLAHSLGKAKATSHISGTHDSRNGV